MTAPATTRGPRHPDLARKHLDCLYPLIKEGVRRELHTEPVDEEIGRLILDACDPRYAFDETRAVMADLGQRALLKALVTAYRDRIGELEAHGEDTFRERAALRLLLSRERKEP